MRIMVTGGAGFIGRNLCERLLAQGHSVLCVDNHYSSSPTNIEALTEHSEFEFVQQDIRHSFDPGDVDQIYNLACPASPPAYQRDPVYTHEVCATGTANMLKLAQQQGITVLHTSTSEIYGDPLVHPQPEHYWGNVNPWGTRSCYDEGKRFAETMCHDYQQLGVSVRVARIFNTYGPHMDPDDGRVISNYITQALTGDAVTIYGDGTQTRSFCYVDDMVEGLIKLMNSDVRVPVNLGNPGEFTMNQLADVLEDIFQQQHRGGFRRVHCELPADDPRQRKPDIALAQQQLNWQPEIQLQQGLAHTVNYFHQRLAQ